VSDPEAALQSLRRKLEQTEQELRNLGYQVERCVNPPGAQIGNQRFDGEILILVLFGRIRSQSGETMVDLVEGDRLHVPSGVPFTLVVEGETPGYWLQAFRPDPTGKG
jgi:quercetin dioxygenase-like cupin family protein